MCALFVFYKKRGVLVNWFFPFIIGKLICLLCDIVWLEDIRLRSEGNKGINKANQ